MRNTLYYLGDAFLATEVAAEKVNDVHRMSYAREVRRDELDRVSLQVEGRWSYVNEAGVELNRRLPGMASIDLDDVLQPGEYRFIALDANARHYCVRRRKSTAPFRPEILRANAGDAFVVPQGRFLFLCSGQIEIGGSYQGERYFILADSAAVQAYAVTDALGMILQP